MRRGKERKGGLRLADVKTVSGKKKRHPFLHGRGEFDSIAAQIAKGGGMELLHNKVDPGGGKRRVLLPQEGKKRGTGEEQAEGTGGKKEEPLSQAERQERRRFSS